MSAGGTLRQNTQIMLPNSFSTLSAPIKFRDAVAAFAAESLFGKRYVQRNLEASMRTREAEVQSYVKHGHWHSTHAAVPTPDLPLLPSSHPSAV